ncbi:uncharacterized protein LOC130949788 [Arachis stenosperma]|uniref:uncharacterized protein LOC130949788 n=1 Tax=Arachis stenosperma TaxID=217475 RepID=UPI0025AD8212|nr:uncharacterized protein LOC130949788 [Arachis stenosperma]
MIAKTTEQVKKLRDGMLTAQSHQKSYADQRRRPLEFEEGDHVFLKVTLTTGVDPGESWTGGVSDGSTTPPFKPARHISRVAASKETPDASHVLELEYVQLKEDLSLLVAPVRSDDTSIK